MKGFLLFTVLTIFVALKSIGQTSEHYDYHPPLKIPLVLSSNFGELRPNHFHMGLDFKTNNKTGYNLYSIEEGYVSRIKVSTYGYGKVVYIDHPNGITSVYAHCEEFKGEIDSIVRLTQESEQNFEVEIFPGKNKIRVKKGQIIAISGNTGGSTAPHLHFEIRDTKTEHALNPLLFGFRMADTKAPEIRNLKAYGLTKEGYRIPGKEVSKAVSKAGANYIIAGNKITVSSSFCTSSGGLGLAFDVIDRFDGASNQCGLFGSYLIVDGDTIFGQKIERVPFESTRYVNSHKDYEAYQSSRNKYQKSFRTAENDLPIYINGSLGLIKTSPGSTHEVEYIAFDANGNTSNLRFTLAVASGEITTEVWSDSKDYLFPQKTYGLTDGNCTIEMGYSTVYEPMAYKKSEVCSHIGDPETPVNRAYKIKLKASEPHDGKHYVRMVTAKSSVKALEVTYEASWAIATSKYFGDFSLERDEKAPSVSSSGFANGSSISESSLSWSISDSESGIDDYDLFIDGKWYLLEYEYKTGKVTFTKPTNLKGKKAVKVIVKDACGNEKIWEGTLNFL